MLPPKGLQIILVSFLSCSYFLICLIPKLSAHGTAAAAGSFTLLKMARRSGVSSGEESEVLLLLKEYCLKRSQLRSQLRSNWSDYAIYQMHSGSNDEREEVTFRSGGTYATHEGGAGVQKDATHEGGAGVRKAVTDRLVQIAESAPIAEVDVEDQDEIIQKLIQLVKTSGDDINQKIQKNKPLQKQLRTLSYNVFEKLTSALQGLLGREEDGAAASASDDRIQKQRIAWAFEVTSRLSAVDIIPRRRLLSFAEEYIQQHHDAWLQQHGGWEEVFESID